MKKYKKHSAGIFVCTILTACALLTAGMVFAQPVLAEGTADEGTWANIGGPVSGQSSGLIPVIAISGGTPYVAFNGGGQFVSKYAGGSWNTLPEIRQYLYTINVSLQIYNNIPYVGYLDAVYDNDFGYAYVKKYDGTKWVSLGNIGSSGSATDMTMDIYNGTPYVAYLDNHNVIVKKYNGSEWVSVGGAVSTSDSLEVVIKIDKSTGTPYVAYTDGTDRNIFVSKFDGNGWVAAGNEISLVMQSHLTLAVSSGQPYVGIYDNVYKLSGGTWQELGNPGTVGSSSNFDLALNGSIPYYVYSDDQNGNKLTLKKYNGSAWENVGSASSAGIVPSLTFDNGIPYIAYVNNIQVYAEKYIPPVQNPPPAQTGTIINCTTSVNVRSGPGTTFPIIGSAPKGAVYTVTGQSGSWYKIDYSGKTGYVSSSYMSVSTTPGDQNPPPAQTGTVVNCTTAVNVRSGPGTTYSIIGSAPKGAKYTVLGQSGSWYKINYNSGTGYISASYFTVSSGTPSQTGTVVNCTTAVNVRSGPGTSYSIIGSAPKGAKYTVTGQSGSWYKIDYYGKTGYISSSYFSVS